MEILVILGIIGGVWFYFSVLRHSDVRVDSTEVAKTFQRVYNLNSSSGEVYDKLDRYRRVMSVVFLAEGLPTVVGDNAATIAESTLVQAMENAPPPLMFRSIVYYSNLLILTTRYNRELKVRELKVIAETVVAEIDPDI